MSFWRNTGSAFLLFALPGFLFVQASVVQRFGGLSASPELNRQQQCFAGAQDSLIPFDL